MSSFNSSLQYCLYDGPTLTKASFMKRFSLSKVKNELDASLVCSTFSSRSEFAAKMAVKNRVKVFIFTIFTQKFQVKTWSTLDAKYLKRN